jgi:hypothetical protein
MLSNNDFNRAVLGQEGSAFLDTAGTTFTAPDGYMVVAITALTPVKFSELKVDSSVSSTSFNISSVGRGGDQFSNADTVPQGVTIYGSWSEVSVSTNDEQCICYLGKK